MILHTINKSPFNHTAYASCMRIVTSADSVLLIEDGVYALLQGHIKTAESSATIYAIKSDVEARGLSKHLTDQITLVDYTKFVELATQASAVQSWY